MRVENRLRIANKFVKERVEGMPSADRKEFLSLARRLPTLLLNSGLVLTVAYLKKRSKEERERGEGSGSSGTKPEELVLSYLSQRLVEAGLLGKDQDLFEYLLDEKGPSPELVSLMLDEALYSAEALKIISEARLEEGSEHGGQS